MFPVETFQITLAKIMTILRGHKIRFHLTGGLTGTAYGEPRMTQEIDIVIDPVETKLRVDALIQSLSGSDFLFSEQTVRQAVNEGGLFKLLDQRECLKLDLYPREMIPGELDRSVSIEIFAGESLPVVSRTDAAASKLVWISKGSHKSRRDLRAIYRDASSDEQQAIRNWATRLDLASLFAEVLQESDELQ